MSPLPAAHSFRGVVFSSIRPDWWSSWDVLLGAPQSLLLLQWALRYLHPLLDLSRLFKPTNKKHWSWVHPTNVFVHIRTFLICV